MLLRHIGHCLSDSDSPAPTCRYPSALYFQASLQLAELAGRAGNASMAADFARRAALIKAAFTPAFWNASEGMFHAAAAGGAEANRIDVWGSALAADVGLASPAQEAAMAAFLTTNAAAIFYEGQVREIPAPHFWNLLAQ